MFTGEVGRVMVSRVDGPVDEVRDAFEGSGGHFWGITGESRLGDLSGAQLWSGLEKVGECTAEWSVREG
jgi:hypothetical protein